MTENLTNTERKLLIEFYTRPQPVGGIRAKGMSKSRAKQFLAALENVAYEAELKQKETDDLRPQ